MTFQPPPPPPGGQPDQPYGAPPPAGPPPGAPWGTPSAGGGYGAAKPGFDPKTVNPLDWGILAAGLLALIFSFTSFYKAKISTSGTCGGFGVPSGSGASENAWHGFFGWFGAIVALAGAVVLAMALFAPQIKLQIPNRLAALGLFALATLSEILALFIHPGTGQSINESFGGCKISAKVGHGFGYWIVLILVIVGLVLALMRFQQSGGQLPGALSKVPNIGGKHDGGSPQVPPPAAPGYGPPAYGQQPPPPGYQPPPPGYQPPPPPGYGQQPPPPPAPPQ